MADTLEQLDAYEKAVPQYGDINKQTARRRADPRVPPGSDVRSAGSDPHWGVNQRLVERVRRYREAPAYTEEIGALLGTIPSTTTPIAESELKPVIRAFESLGLFKFRLRVVKHGMPAFNVQISRMDNADAWETVAFATTSPVTVTVTPTPPTNPNASTSAHF